MEVQEISVNDALRESIEAQLEPTKVEVKQPNTGFAALDNPTEPEAPAAPAADPDLDKRMTKVMAQAQKVQAERAAFAAEQAKYKADMEELAQFRQLKAVSKEDPVAWAEAGGYKPDEYATVLMEKGALTPEKRKILEQQRELSELKQWRQTMEKREAEAQTQGLYQGVRKELESFAETNKESYDLVGRTKSYDRVLGKIQEHYQKTAALGEPEILPYETAFAAVEKELEDFYRPVLESPKFKQAQASPTPSAQGAGRKVAGTINSKLRAQATEAPGKPKLSDSERFQKAGEVLLSQIYGRR